MEKTVVELFAGVGGFRVGLNDVILDAKGKAKEKNSFRFVWANQWEPSTKTQHAYECYKFRFDDDISNMDIALVDKTSIPNHSLLVGGVLVRIILLPEAYLKNRVFKVKKVFCGGKSMKY